MLFLGRCEKVTVLHINQKVCMLYINNSICFVLEVHGEIRKMSTKHFLWKIFYVEKRCLKMVFKPLKHNGTEYIVLQVLC